MNDAVDFTRLGPVYLHWSEWSDAAVIGPEQGAWGGDDWFRCDTHGDWNGYGSDDFVSHAAEHGYYVGSLTGVAA
jgi:hypothetical protein